MIRRLVPVFVLLVTIAGAAFAQTASGVADAVALSQRVRTVANVTYVRANGWEGKLDLYLQRAPTDSPPVPVVIHFHGGGWVEGTKEAAAIQGVLPYVAMGYSVVNVEYRLASVSLAPAAIEDCRCALRWVADHAKEYNFDAARIVVAGASAGGHLALTTGYIPANAGMDRVCYSTREPKVAAVVNFYGITDIADLLEGPDRKPFPEGWPYTTQWLGNQPNRAEIAKAASPLTYVRPGLPPTITIHGDQDPVVPYAHSVRLQDALDRAGVIHELVTISGGRHGNFLLAEWQRAYAAIERFLTANVGSAGTRTTAGPQPR